MWWRATQGKPRGPRVWGPSSMALGGTISLRRRRDTLGGVGTLRCLTSQRGSWSDWLRVEVPAAERNRERRLGWRLGRELGSAHQENEGR